MRVIGSSMLPAIRPGDIVTVRSGLPARAAIGEVVLFLRESRFFVHRVVGRRGSALVTRGDALATPDPPVEPGEFLGFVVATERGRRPPAGPRQSALDRAAASLFRRSPFAGRLFTRLNALASRGRE